MDDPAQRPRPAHDPHGGWRRRWLLTAAAMLATLLLVYLTSAVLPLARPSGLYSGLGSLMMLPLLLVCATVAGMSATVAMAIAAYHAGVRRLGYWLVLSAAGVLGFVAFFAGYESPWIGDRAVARRALADRQPMLEAMLDHRARLQPAIAGDDLTPLQAVLATGDPTLTPAQLLCLVRSDVIEGRGGAMPAVSERRYRFLDAVADMAWRHDDSAQDRQAIGLLAVDAALRHGAPADLQRWLERGVRVHGIHWHEHVSARTDPAGQCGTVVHWPLNLLRHNPHDPAGKLALLLQHGVQPRSPMPDMGLFELGPLSAATLTRLSSLGLPVDRRETGAPLALAVRMAGRRCETGCAGTFAFDDDELVDYIRRLRDAGARPEHVAWDGRDAWATLADVRQRLASPQRHARGREATPETAADAAGQPDAARVDLMRRIEQVLGDDPRSVQPAAGPAAAPSG